MRTTTTRPSRHIERTAGNPAAAFSRSFAPIQAGGAVSLGVACAGSGGLLGRVARGDGGCWHSVFQVGRTVGEIR
jgi:hypothetical protein